MTRSKSKHKALKGKQAKKAVASSSSNFSSDGGRGGKRSSSDSQSNYCQVPTVRSNSQAHKHSNSSSSQTFSAAFEAPSPKPKRASISASKASCVRSSRGSRAASKSTSSSSTQGFSYAFQGPSSKLSRNSKSAYKDAKSSSNQGFSAAFQGPSHKSNLGSSASNKWPSQNITRRASSLSNNGGKENAFSVAGPGNANLRANLGSRLKYENGKIVRMPRKRVDPIKYKSHLRNHNVPQGASSTGIDSSQDMELSRAPKELVLEELNSAYLLAGSEGDPEPFLVPIADHLKTDNFLDRQVDPPKLVRFMVTMMNKLYDLTADSDPQSEQRRHTEEVIWDTVLYLIPLLCNQMIKHLRDEPLIVTTEPDAVVFGDLHGNFTDLWYIYKHYIDNQQYEKHRFVFLGDYVDRGPKPIEILCLLFALKLAHPNRFVLLRGNHEVMKMNQKYGFQKLCLQIYKDTFIKQPVTGQFVFKWFNEAFSYLPLAAVIKGNESQSVFCCHGGVPVGHAMSQHCDDDSQDHQPWQIDQLNALTQKPTILTPSAHAPAELMVLNQLLWNDPLPKSVQYQPNKVKRTFYRSINRGGHCCLLTEPALQAFLEANHLAMLIRGHQIRHTRATGYSYDFNGRCLTVFSSSNYCGTESNVTGCAVVTGQDCQVEARVLRNIEESAQYRNFNMFRVVIDPKTYKMEVIF